jgi:hypothetical protein
MLTYIYIHTHTAALNAVLIAEALMEPVGKAFTPKM